MKKKICMILIAVFVAVLGASTYFIIDHYKESNKQAELYSELADLVNAAAQTDAATEPAEQIPYSEFAHLEKFKNKDFWSDHRIITFNTLTDKQEYEIVAVFRTVVYTDSPEAFKFYRFIDAESANEFDDFIAKCKELSFYDTGVTAEYGDKLITLSTCEYSRNNSRLVVVAKRITEDGGADAAKTHAEATAEGERPN